MLKRCLDLDLIIQKVVNETIYGITMDVSFYNRHYKTLMWTTPETVFIRYEDYNNWEIVEENFYE